MPRNKTLEQEFEKKLVDNIGKTVSFIYGTPKGKDKKFEQKYIIGKIGKFKRDFTNSTYGHFVYIGKIDGKLKNKILAGIIDSNVIFNESKKPENYQEKYYIRRISELEILD